MDSEREILFVGGACKQIVAIIKEESISKYLGTNPGSGTAVLSDIRLYRYEH